MNGVDKLKLELENQKKLTEKYKTQIKDLKEKNSKLIFFLIFLKFNFLASGERSVKINENSCSNFELNEEFEETKNIRILNKNIENAEETEFNMNLLIERPADIFQYNIKTFFLKLIIKFDKFKERTPQK